MISRTDYERAQKLALEFLHKAGIALTPQEAGRIEVADFGLGELWQTGLQLLIYLNTERVCAKELVLLPGQTCPEHRHPPGPATGPGKEETFRCRWGQVYLYVEGEASPNPKASPPPGRYEYYTAWREVVLHPGQQYTLPPDTLHWFQGGPQGAVVSEFSTHSHDDSDAFTDPGIQRRPQVAGQ
jgi:D-lyxose ketol-isomerase